MEAQRRAEAGGTRPRLQPPARSRRQYLFPRQGLLARRQELPPGGVDHVGHEPGGLFGDDDRRRPLARRAAVQEGAEVMARITAGLATSHIPALGAAVDLGKTAEAYWQPAFAGYEWTKKWVVGEKPDVVILVYNDHASA